MPQVGLEPTITEFEQEKTFHALYHAATVIGSSFSVKVRECEVVPVLMNHPIKTHGKVEKMLRIFSNSR
jgi:hypothetical protein